MTVVVPSKLPIFRSKSLQNYMRNRERSILPRIVAPPVFALCWIVLILLLAAGIFTWSGQVPFYSAGTGIVLSANSLSSQEDRAAAVILLPANASLYIRPGLPIQLQIGQSGPHLHCTIDTVKNLLSPGEIRRQYGLIVADPSLVVIVALGSTISEHLYSGSPIQAQIQIGSQSLLALFPLVNGMLKG